MDNLNHLNCFSSKFNKEWKCIVFVFILALCIRKSTANDFPSLLIANASLGIILDHEFLGDEYEATLEAVKESVEKVLREDMKGGGIMVRYYSWSRINFNKDFTVILSVANCKETWEIFAHAQKETLLLLAITDADCPRLPPKEALMIPFAKLGQELPQILLDIRAAGAINWKNAIVLYDDIFDRDTVSRVANALSSIISGNDIMAMTVSLLKLNSSTEIGERKENIRKSLLSFPEIAVGKNYMVIATIPTIIIEVATEMGLIESTSQWLFLISNAKNLKSNSSSLLPFIREGGNVAIATNNSVTDTNCTSAKKCHLYELLRNLVLALTKMIREEEAIYGQISDEEWEAIRLTKRERRDGMLGYIKNHLKDSPVCTPCVRWTFETAETWGLRFLTPHINGTTEFKPKITIAAEWDQTNGLLLKDALFPHISFGFRNKRLPIATFHNPPWQNLTFNETGEVTGKSGIVFHILDQLALKLNFSYYIMNVERNVNRTMYPYLDDFNTTSADEIKATFLLPADVLELLTTNSVIFGAVALTVSELYDKSVNYTFPISIQTYSMLISRPKELSRLYLFVAPFTTDTWLCLMATIALVGPLLYVFNYASPYHEYFNIKKKGGLFKLGNCFWYIYGALLQQGGMYLPRSDSGRIIVGTWWLVVLVVVTTYCGNLVAFLTFPKMEVPVNTIDELVNTNNMFTWGIRQNTFLQQYLKETDIEKYIRLNASVILHERASNDIVEKVKSRKHIFIDWETNIQYIMRKSYLETDRCDFSMSTHTFLDEKISLILPVNSPYLNIFNAEIYRLLQMGFIQKWSAEYMPKKDRCSSNRRSMEFENHTVNLMDMQGCFLILIAGFITSIIILLCECIFRKNRCLSDKKIIKPFTK